MSAVLLPASFWLLQEHQISTVAAAICPCHLFSYSCLILELPASFLLAHALLRATDVCSNPVGQFPHFKDSNV